MSDKKKILAVENLNFLKSLCNKRRQDIKFILKKASPDNINAISELFDNILKGNISCSKQKKKKIVPYKNHIRQIANKNNTVSKRRKHMIKGGFLLGILLPAAISVVSEVISQIKK